MASMVVFGGGSDRSEMSVRVSEDVEQVLKAFTSAAGNPFALTNDNGGARIYVNPATVAYWREASRVGFQ